MILNSPGGDVMHNQADTRPYDGAMSWGAPAAVRSHASDPHRPSHLGTRAVRSSAPRDRGPSPRRATPTWAQRSERPWRVRCQDEPHDSCALDW